MCSDAHSITLSENIIYQETIMLSETIIYQETIINRKTAIIFVSIPKDLLSNTVCPSEQKSTKYL